MRSLNVLLIITILVVHSSMCARKITKSHSSYSTTEESTSYSKSELSVVISDDADKYANLTEYNVTAELESYEKERYLDHNVTELVLDHFLVSSRILKAITRSTSDDTEKLRLLQEKEFKSNTIYKDAWVRGKALLVEKRQDPTLTAVKETKGIPDEYHIALITYSLAFPSLYHDFNTKTRTIKKVSEIDSYQWKSYFKFLLLALNKVQGHPTKKEKPEVLYRGLTGWFKMGVGEKVMFQHFVSTSSDSDIAKYFSFEDASTLFEIRGVVSQSIGLDHHSVFAEKEWVLAPRQLYSVENITEHTNRYKGKIRRILLKSLGDSELVVSRASYFNINSFLLCIVITRVISGQYILGDPE